MPASVLVTPVRVFYERVLSHKFAAEIKRNSRAGSEAKL
jgi:hypothetical protein